MHLIAAAAVQTEAAIENSMGEGERRVVKERERNRLKTDSMKGFKREKWRYKWRERQEEEILTE